MHLERIPRTPAVLPGAQAGLTLGLISHIGAAGYAKSILAHLSGVVNVGAMCAYHVSQHQPPALILGATLGRDEITQACWNVYRGGIYRCDSSFRSAAQLVQAGDLAVASVRAEDLPEQHKRGIYEQHALGERLSVIAAHGADAILAFNLYRFQGEARFSQSELAAVAGFAPIIVACIEKHDEFLRMQQPVAEKTDAAIRQLLQARCPELTAREVDVCRGILRGWTFDGIAADLGISAATVKTYRDRSFLRLGIRQRTELASLLQG